LLLGIGSSYLAHSPITALEESIIAFLRIIEDSSFPSKIEFLAEPL